MNPRTLSLAAALLTPLLLTAQAQTPAAALPAAWTGARLATATYVILDPQMVGPNLLGGSDQTSVLDAMRRDSGNALKRRYPGATISTDTATAGAIRVIPVLNTPSALLPWLKLTARLDLTLPEGGKVSLAQEFTLWDVYQHRAEAANFVYNQLALRLP
ncbi:hypothetical protein ACI3L1_17715 [Deinococcus sp. SM5_A1]|uniref:hypothetical protein n=1 Tax=Deinococcus sp. SM5_A1 TaxID=3379094 RepID=UPI00385EFE91